MPTAPWMKGPLLLQPHEVLNPTKPTTKRSSNGNAESPDKALFGKESGVRGKKVMEKIIRNVERLQGNEVFEETQSEICEEFEVGDWLEELGSDGEVKRFNGRMPWLRDEEKVVFRRMKKEKVLTQAEISLDKDLLERLRGKAMRMRKWIKVMKAGVTQAVVDEIKSSWRKNGLVMLKFGVPLCRNMDRAREIVEMKTGGLVVWSKKDALVVFRGCKHELTSKISPMEYSHSASGQETSSLTCSNLTSGNNINLSQEKFNTSTLGKSLYREEKEKESMPTSIFVKSDDNNEMVMGSLYEREIDRLLDGLGPRFIDWWMRKPLPVDADLLPEVVPGFRPPLRLSPPNTRRKLRGDELTYLRKLAHPLPFHFALGRNRNLQGLAAAILKLWEKSLVAKIAIKWGIQNTDNEQMAYELKNLTGGVLLLRNKYLIILYRGKDFLPQGVADMVMEREVALRRCQLNEEGAQVKVAETFQVPDEPLAKTSTVGTLSEFQDIQSKFGDLLKIKIEKSAKELEKLNSSCQPAQQDVDQEFITEEERECLRRIGLKLNSCLVLGRRGVFDGVIEGVHQHWKHREVVKIITMQRVFSRVIYTAKMLVAESGGILVSIEKLKEGHAIIMYRGKNYRRPPKLMTDNLLTRREALKRSIEMQRIGSLKFFAYQRQQAILDLKLKLALIQAYCVYSLSLRCATEKSIANTYSDDLAQYPESKVGMMKL
ncbi:hypothetical protein COLO4_09355 [Corchorus olitorius]|uniref:CRM domain-containing protein n=1 Tax=Corchorus olitorius TaxID=93759 RepID=A0A1R3KCH0_9ROSI|nr:hypothetical protein COLO4_09355 [Corchorus olitorius]